MIELTDIRGEKIYILGAYIVVIMKRTKDLPKEINSIIVLVSGASVYVRESCVEINSLLRGY